MSKIAEFKALEAQLAEQMKQLDVMRNDDRLKREIEFEGKLRTLMGEYNASLPVIISLLDPYARQTVKTGIKSTRRERTIKRYKNPNTGEVVETKGGNHRILKQWKSEYGTQEVESWFQ
ncbi:histone-like nucleoid-structuring protein, MvaT/MvaU family [Pseudomonas chlororaphis]|uniref:histone-like nucleoid-structuring protein, MvaT/MvaU family n=1 Tax=Pseudomonas chlororaphis TaxID=587753 RepID=UPI0006A6529D|nr:histone-like nucleoid-structuring protein, MvaT/MvaU family [Pseudomonas chlororaphis]